MTRLKLDEVLNDALVDRAYDLFTAELDHWQIAGPDANGQWLLTRRSTQQGYAIIMPGAEPVAEESFQNFVAKDKAFANACIQWHGLQAVLKGLALPADAPPPPAENPTPAPSR